MSHLHEQAKAVFLKAVALPAGQRGEFVAQACAHDDSLRQEVESLLAHHRPQTLLPDTMPDAPCPAHERPTDLDLAAVGSKAVGRKPERISGLVFAQLFGNLRRRYAAVLVALGFVLALGILVYGLVQRAMKIKLEQELTTILAVDVEALRIWMGLQEATAAAIAADPDVRRLAARLIPLSRSDPRAALSSTASDELRQLRVQIQPLLETHGYQGFVLVDRQGHVVAASEDWLIGDVRLMADEQSLDIVFAYRYRLLRAPRRAAGC
jgi:hypothetical protein